MRRKIFLIIIAELLLSSLCFGYSGGDGTPGDPYQIANATDLLELAATTNDYSKVFILTADIDLSGVKITPVGNSNTPFTGVFDGCGHTISNLNKSTSTQDYIGLFGYVDTGGQIKNLGMVNANIHGHNFVGGLVGYNYGTLAACYTTGSVIGGSYVGGLVGENYGTLIACYSAASVTGIDTWYYSSVGGLVGSNGGTLTVCYASGSVSGGSSVGGLVGSSYVFLGRVSITSCFWDVQISGQSGSSGGKGLTTEQMKTMSIYQNAGWDGKGWVINDRADYPRLSWENTEGVAIPAAVIPFVGRGTADDPYLITTAQEFALLSWYSEILDKHISLKANLDLTGIMLYPIGDLGLFSGVFNGNDHTISNAVINQPGNDFVGLFSRVGNHRLIMNIGVMNADIQGRSNVGGLVGYNRDSTITSCYVTGAVNGSSNVGGLVGYNGSIIYYSSGNITFCYATCTVSGSSVVGGLVGINESGSIDSCYATGSATGNIDIGGLVGVNEYGSINFCYATGAVTVTGPYFVAGGLVGGCYGCTINFCYATGAVTAPSLSSNVGGLVGGIHNDAMIIGSFWDVETTGQTTSAGGTGLTTAEMKSYSTFNGAGWDFVAETANGTVDIWTMTFDSYPILLWQQPYPVEYSGGSGTADDPYQISTKADLLSLAVTPRDYDKYFILTENIDLAGEIFTAAVIAPYMDMDEGYSGFQGPTFTGVFDGNGKKINNLVIRGINRSYIGLFGCLGSGGLVKNLGVAQADIQGYSLVGGLIGSVCNATITSCYVTGAVSGFYSVGGLVGDTGGWGSSSITSCYTMSIITSGDYSYGIGGLVGLIDSLSSIKSCYATGSVTGGYISGALGGLAGFNWEGTITSCYATGNVTSGDESWSVGGLIGANLSGTITSCYAIGSVTSGEESVNLGGLVGQNYDSEVNISFWDIESSGQTTSAGGTGLTTAEMKSSLAFIEAGWDFTEADGDPADWKMSELGSDYPRLAWQSVLESPIEYVVFPKKAGNGGFVTVNVVIISGNASFTEGMTVKLTGEGIPDISAQSIRIVHPWQIDADFDLAEVPLGNRNVIIDNTNSQPSRLISAYESSGMSSNTSSTNTGSLDVVPGIAPQIEASIKGPIQVRVGRTAHFDLQIRAIGNYNAADITTWLNVPSSVPTLLPGLGSQWPLHWWYQGTYWRTDESWNGRERVSAQIPSLSPFFLPTTVRSLIVDIPPDTSLIGTKLTIKVGTNTEVAVRNELIGAGYIIWESVPGATEVGGLLECSIDGLKTFANGYSNDITLTGGSEPHTANPPFDHKGGYKTDFDITDSSDPFDLVVDSNPIDLICTYIRDFPGAIRVNPTSWNGYLQEYKIGEVRYGAEKSGNVANHLDITWAENHCETAGGYGGNRKEFEIEIVGSIDPSDIFGPLGVGEPRWIQTGTPLPYTIMFENKPEAIAPAVDVLVTDVLDSQAFDISSVMLGPIEFQGKTAMPSLLNSPPVGTREFWADVDLRPENNLIVRVHCKLDMVTSELIWSFNSLDPNTFQPPDDPMAGFLPPGAGGQVSYTIAPKETLQTGFAIENSAEIVFDINPPLVTSIWYNTIDNIPPVSEVLPLPVYSTSPNFIVQWTGQDDTNGSGIKDFDIYVSEDGGDFKSWQISKTQSSSQYTGIIGHTYAFCSKARDFAINVEAMHTHPDAVTTVVILPPEPVFDIVTDSMRFDRRTGQSSVEVTITNISAQSTSGDVWLVVDNITSAAITLVNPDGTTAEGKPYINLTGLLSDGALSPGESIAQRICFDNPNRLRFRAELSVYGAPEGSAGSAGTTFTVGDLPRSNIDGLGVVNLEDFARLAGQWQQTGCGDANAWCAGADINQDSKVDVLDIAALTEDWLH